LTYSTAKHIGATLFSQEPRHGTVLMLWRLQYLLINDLSVFYVEKGDLWRLPEVLPQFSLVGGYGYSLIHD
jgi:hypothetical protein